MRYILKIAMTVIVACFASASASIAAEKAEYDWRLPAWAPKPVVPADNLMSEAKVELGRRLFYDKRLSLDDTISCGSCHQQSKSFTDGRRLPLGVHDTPGVRNAMNLANVGYLPVLTWANPNLNKLETQMLLPIFGDNPVEMGMAGKEKQLIEKLGKDAKYLALFRNAFPEKGGAITLDTITKAIAAFERALISFNSPYDRYKRGGDSNALSPAAKRGEKLFFSEKFECEHCHNGPNFNDNIQHSRMAFPEFGFHNTGLYNVDGKGGYPADNHGISSVTQDPADEGKFRTATLRNISVTGPFMHDGAIASLKEVILNHYAKKGKAVHDGKAPNPLRSQFIEGFQISDSDANDLVAFLEALTDESFLKDPRFSDPFAEKGMAP